MAKEPPESSASPLRERLLLTLRLLIYAVSLLLFWKGIREYWYIPRIPGTYSIFLLVPAWAGLFWLWRREKLASWVAALLVSTLTLLASSADMAAFVYRPLFSDPDGIAHPAVESVVGRHDLRRLEIAPFLEKLRFAPAKSARDLYLLAGVPWRGYWSGVTHLAARPYADGRTPWRTAHGAPLADARWVSTAGGLLAVSKQPPAVMMLDPLSLEVRLSVPWTLGGMPSLVDEEEATGRLLVIAEGEGQIAWVDPITLVLTPLDPLAPQARALGARLAPYAFAPYQLSPPYRGKRYLTLWQATTVLLELDATTWRVTRVLQTDARNVFDLQIFRFMGLALDERAGRLWVADSFAGWNGRVLEIELAGLTVRRELAAPPGVRGLVFDPLRGRLYGTSCMDGRLLVYEVAPEGLSLHAEIPLGRWLRVLEWEGAPGRSHLLAGSAAGVFRIDPGRL